MKINWRYTIGEVLIVIIGISIAFALNNWKENNADQKLKAQYFENLVLDLKDEIAHISDNTKSIEQKLGFIKEIRPYLGRQIPGKDSMVMKFFELAQIVQFYPEQTTYMTLVNSGDMKLIDNFSLRRSLEEHVSIQNKLLTDYQRIENIQQKYVSDFFIYHLNFNDIFRGDTSFLDNPLVANIISSMDGAYRIILEGNKNCLENNKELLEMLKLEMHGG